MAKQLRQARAVARAASNWVRHDLREILFPSSIPNPPGIEEEHEQQRAKRDWPKVCAHVGRVPPLCCCCLPLPHSCLGCIILRCCCTTVCSAAASIVKR